MAPQEKVNELARKLVDKNLRGEFVMPFSVRALASALEEALDGVDRPVAPTEPVRATVGCWLTRDGSKAVVEKEEDYHDWNFLGRVIDHRVGNEKSFWTSKGFYWKEQGRIDDYDLLTFISPDVEFWEKEERIAAIHSIKDQQDLKPKPFDWTQLPASFVVKFEGETGHYSPIHIDEYGLRIYIKTMSTTYPWEKLKDSSIRWSTDRKTWREFR